MLLFSSLIFIKPDATRFKKDKHFFCPVLVPSAPPENVTLTALSSSSLLVKWSDVPMEHRNGEIVGYVIKMWSYVLNYTETIQINNRSQYIFQKDGLNKYQKYWFVVRAKTSVGWGSRKWVMGWTLQDSKKMFFYLILLLLLLLSLLQLQIILYIPYYNICFFSIYLSSFCSTRRCPRYSSFIDITGYHVVQCP